MHDTKAYDEIMRNGWPPEKVVAGMLTNLKHAGSGSVPLELSAAVFSLLVERYENFGAVMQWEYWDALPKEGEGRAWMSAYCIVLCMGMKKVRDVAMVVALWRGMKCADTTLTKDVIELSAWDRHASQQRFDRVSEAVRTF